MCYDMYEMSNVAHYVLLQTTAHVFGVGVMDYMLPWRMSIHIHKQIYVYTCIHMYKRTSCIVFSLMRFTDYIAHVCHICT